MAPVKDSGKAAEELANEVFSEVTAKGFIEPFSEKRTLDCLKDECLMHPFDHASMIELARRAKFFDFNADGKLAGEFSTYCRMCLLDGEKLKESKGMHTVHMLLNFDERILDFKKPELFWMMENINILCLERWQTSQMHHIEVEGTKFLEGLKNMKIPSF